MLDSIREDEDLPLRRLFQDILENLCQPFGATRLLRSAC
jgi:hypothetical protein